MRGKAWIAILFLALVGASSALNASAEVTTSAAYGYLPYGMGGLLGGPLPIGGALSYDPPQDSSSDSWTLRGVIFALALALSLGAAAEDLRRRKIPNWIVAPAAVLGLLIHAALAGWRGFGHSLLGLLLGLSFLFVFYLLGGMGAGDVKLMGAAGALLGAPHVAYAFVLTGLLGGLMAMAFKLNNPALTKIPYGVAIGAGMVLSFLVVGGPYA